MCLLVILVSSSFLAYMCLLLCISYILLLVFIFLSSFLSSLGPYLPHFLFLFLVSLCPSVYILISSAAIVHLSLNPSLHPYVLLAFHVSLPPSIHPFCPDAVVRTEIILSFVPSFVFCHF